MPYINKFQLDGELRSQLNFEFIPIYEGGILSGESPAVPFEDGALLAAGSDSAVYVRFKATPLMVQTANVWIYFTFLAGASTADFDFDIYYQQFPVGEPPGAIMGPIAASITPDGTTDLQSTICVINDEIIAWRIPAPVKKNSYVRFEIVRKGSTDTNPDDLKIMDVSYATIPTYQTLSGFAKGLVQPLVPGPTGTNILNDRGQLLSHDGGGDVFIPYPGDGKVLVTDDTDPVGVIWVDQNTIGGASKREFAPATISTTTVLTDTDVKFYHKTFNPSAFANITVTLPDATTLENGDFIGFYITQANVSGFFVDIEPAGGNQLFDLTNGSIAVLQVGDVVGEVVELHTDGTDWYITNLYEESAATANFTLKTTTHTVAFNGETNFTLGEDAEVPFFMYVNGVIYTSPSHFTVGGVGNRDWVWQDLLFTLSVGDEVVCVYGSGPAAGGSGGMDFEIFSATGVANESFQLSQAAASPFFMYVNGFVYTTPTYFSLSTTVFTNDTYTWDDAGAGFGMSPGDEVVCVFFIP